jgi:hypothetical protein
MPAHESREGPGSSWLDFALPPEDSGTSRAGIAPLSRARRLPTMRSKTRAIATERLVRAESRIRGRVRPSRRDARRSRDSVRGWSGDTASANHRQGRQKVRVWSHMASATMNLWGPSPYVRLRRPHTGHPQASSRCPLLVGIRSGDATGLDRRLEVHAARVHGGLLREARTHFTQRTEFRDVRD